MTAVPTVVIVGRPNVGKSTLFNRIVGGRQAIVHNRAGVTRDRHFQLTDWAGKSFWLVDTGGWLPGDPDAFTRGIRRQVELAVADADAIVFVVDTKEGPHPADEEVAELLRSIKDRVVLAANKADNLPEVTGHHEFYRLGLGEPVPVSSTTGKGSGDLLDRLVTLLPGHVRREPEEEIATQVAVIGRPNVGKSSIVNCLLGQERTLVTPVAGTTRDAVDSPLRYRDETLNFIDTAGLRRRSKVEDEVEFYSALRTERALQRAHVAVLVVDAAEGINTQDLKIAESAWSEGKALIVAVNKWDLVKEKDTATARRGWSAAVERAPFLKAVPFVFVSAETGQRVRKILDLILQVAAQRRVRIPTSEVNRILEQLVQRNQPPQKGGEEVKLLYASQIGIAPPSFAIVSNRPDAIPEAYRRYLVNGFRAAWKFEGSPIRLKFTRRKKTPPK